MPNTQHAIIAICFSLLLLISERTAFAAAEIPSPQKDWQQIIRGSPYWISQGTFDNLTTLRRWVLTATAYCANPQRHILFDRRAQFLGYFANQDNSEATQALLNAYRAQMVVAGDVGTWVAGSELQAGYPFALNCDQPNANLEAAFARYIGKVPSARLWGTWDGMVIGTVDQTVSLHDALGLVFANRQALGRISLPEEILSTLAGKILIESGARPKAHSVADAKGIMQLSPAALSDCELAERFHFHRMAQIDCAFKLLEQNHRLLEPAFQSIFSHLPKDKSAELYAYLLLQAYHGGIGRIRDLLTDPDMNGAAIYFARHAEKFSAGDIALGMVFHNLGRNQLGFYSWYYVVDVGIAKRYACRRLPELPGCAG